MIRLSIHETDEYNGHVVAAEAAHRAVRGEAPRHQLLADIFGLQTTRDSPRHEVDHLLQEEQRELESQRSGKHKYRSTDLIRQDVPDAVAGENDELPIVVDRLDGNLGATRDNLLRKASK